MAVDLRLVLLLLVLLRLVLLRLVLLRAVRAVVPVAEEWAE